MLHLSSERLAELADSEPTLAEAEHLAACAICATERSAHQRLLTMAVSERDRTAPALTDWSTLSAKLRAEGIIADNEDAVSTETTVVPIGSARPRAHRRAWLFGFRAAAAVVFAVGFGALGRMSAGAKPAPSAREVASLFKHVVGDSVLPATMDRMLDQRAQLGSVQEALAALETAQRDYDRAVEFIAAHDSTAHSPDARDVFRTRLAALDEMAETSRQALTSAPTDLVLNQYYLSTLGAREITLRQLGSALPAGTKLTRF